MSERTFKGYGRSWTEDKAAGLARLFQVMREPATKKTYFVLGGIFLVVTGAIEIWLF